MRLVDECHALGWTDGLPVIPPTIQLVNQMLGPWADRADEFVADVPPAFGHATFETIAANCVMAGCTPDHLAIVIAAVRAISTPRFGLDVVATGLNSASPVVIIDGPMVEGLKFNHGPGALGAGNRANASVGRAVQLCIRNIGGSRPGEMDGATQGHPGKYSYLIAAGPSPWEPLRTRLGYQLKDTTVTVYAADAPLTIADMGHDDPTSILQTICASVAIPGSYNAYLRKDLWLVMAPEHAWRLYDAGFGLAQIAAFIHENAVIRAGDLRGRGLYGFIDESIPPTWIEGVTDDEPIGIVDRPDRVKIVVSGGMFGGYTSAILGQGVSVTTKAEAT